MYHLDVSELVHIADNTYLEKQILSMAESLVEVLWFNVSNPTIIIFLKLVCIHYKVPVKTMYLAMVSFYIHVLVHCLFFNNINNEKVICISSIWLN